MHKSKIIILIFLSISLFLLTVKVNAQVNIKIGYSIGYMQAPTTNSIISDFNTDHAFYENPLENFNFLHGVLIGLRYRLDDVAVHFDWNNKFNLLQGSGIYPNDTKAAYEKLYFKTTSFGLGLEFFGTEKFSLGGTLDYDLLRYRVQNDANTTKVTVLNDSAWGSHFYISINVEGTDILTLNLQPYVQIPWTSYDLHSLDNSVNSKDSMDKLSEKYLNYGVRVIFSNGAF